MKRGARVVLLAGGSLLVTLGFFALAVAGWGGGWRSFLANPARRVAFVASLPLSVVAGIVIGRSSDLSPLSSGVREDRTNRWIFLPGGVLPIPTQKAAHAPHDVSAVEQAATAVTSLNCPL